MANPTVSTAYQFNGYVETLAVPFFRNNLVAIPDRETGFYPAGAKTQPTLDKLYFSDPNIAKPNVHPDPDITAYLPTKLNVG